MAEGGGSPPRFRRYRYSELVEDRYSELVEAEQELEDLLATGSPCSTSEIDRLQNALECPNALEPPDYRTHWNLTKWEDEYRPKWEDERRPEWDYGHRPKWRDEHRPKWEEEHRPEWEDEHRPEWEDECRSSPGLEELYRRPQTPTTGYRRLGPALPKLSIQVPPVSDDSDDEIRQRTSTDQSPDRPRWRVDIQVREPRLEDIGCCNFCLGTVLKPYPINYEIITMSDSPLLCANYMVVRRWDEDFIRLYNSLSYQFAFNARLQSGLSEHRPRRLSELNEDSLALQCGRHKKFLKWIMSNNAFYSNHDLHAFIGCKADGCPSQNTDSIKKFPPYPRGTQRRSSPVHED